MNKILKIMQNKISTLVGLIIIIAVALIAFGGVFSWQSYVVNKSNQLSVIKIEKTEWKSFCFNGNSICFKYPSKFCYDKNDCRDLYVIDNLDAFIIGGKIQNGTSEYIQPIVSIYYVNGIGQKDTEKYLRLNIPWTADKDNPNVFTTTTKYIPNYAGYSKDLKTLIWFKTNFACFFNCGQTEKTFLHSIKLDGVEIYGGGY